MIDLLDSDGENMAVRSFLALYGGTNAVSTDRMRNHLAMSGFEDCWPDWAVQDQHLTKGGAQDWIRYLFSLEPSRAQPERKLTDGLPPLPFSPYMRIDWKDKQNSTTLYTADQMREYAQKALLAAQPAAATVPEWQPIETAPKDGTRVLLVIDHGEWGDKVWTGLWADSWMVSYGKARTEPTHWMPLPQPPAAQPQDDGEKQ